MGLHPVKIEIGDAIITPKDTVRNLGAVIPSSLSMQNQVNAVTRGMYYNIGHIAKVKRHLTTSACAKAVTATVLSSLTITGCCWEHLKIP